MECLGESGLGTDELGCDAEVEEATPESNTERSPDRDSERHNTAEKPSSDLLDYSDVLKLETEEAQVDQLQTHKDLSVTPTPIEWPCGGLLQTFYGTFSPPANRGPAQFCVWTLDPQDSRPLRLDLQQLVLGHGDRLTVYDREQGKGDIIKVVSYLTKRTMSTFFTK